MGAPARRRGREGEAVSADGVAARRLAPRRRDDARRPRPPARKGAPHRPPVEQRDSRRRGPAVCRAAVPRARLLGPPLPPPAPRRPPRDVARRARLPEVVPHLRRLGAPRAARGRREARPRGQREGGGAEEEEEEEGGRRRRPFERRRRRRRRQPRGGGAQRVARQLAGPRPPREAASVRRAVGLRLQGGVDGRGARHHAHLRRRVWRRARLPESCAALALLKPDGTTAAPQLTNSLLSSFGSGGARRATSA